MSVKRYPCTIYGIHYESEYAAGKALGLNVGALRFRLRSPNYPECISQHHAKLDVKLKNQPCTINGVAYESESAAARAFGIHAHVLRNRLRSSSYPEYTSRYQIKEGRRKRAFSCRVDGVEYASISDAARKLELSATALRTRLASPDFPDYVCADILKKPSEPPRYTVRGKPYRTLQEIANAEGVTREWIRQKMNDPSYPDHISADIPKGPPPSPKYMVNGKPYRTLREIAEAEELTVYKVKQKLDNPSRLEYQQLYKKRT